jgi:hypothetical protein
MCYSSSSQSGFGLRRKNHGSRPDGPFHNRRIFLEIFRILFREALASLFNSSIAKLSTASHAHAWFRTIAALQLCELPAEEGTFADSSRAIRKSDVAPCSARASERSIAEGSFEGVPGVLLF